MNFEQLCETTMNSETRNLVKVKLEDTIKTDEIFSVFMGAYLEKRSVHIKANAKYVTNL